MFPAALATLLAFAPVSCMATTTGGELMGFLLGGDRHFDGLRELSSSAASCPSTENLVYYNTSINMSIFDSSFAGCSDMEMEDVSIKLTEGFDGVVDLDPRLSDVVVSLETAICDPIPTNLTNATRRSRGLNFIYNYARGRTSGSGFGFNWGGSGRCRYCPPDDNDANHRLRFLRGGHEEGGGQGYAAFSYEDAVKAAQRKLDDEDDEDDDDDDDETGTTITGFSLYDANTGTKLKTLNDQDVIDIQVYGSDLTIVAEYVGTQPVAINFGLDETRRYSTRTSSLFSLEGGSDTNLQSVSELQNIGTHYVAATPYSNMEDADEGEDGGSSYSLFFLIVDGATNAGSSSSSDIGSQEELIDIIEDDVSFFLSAYINSHYFLDSSSCLYHTLAWVKVEITVVADASETACLPP